MKEIPIMKHITALLLASLLLTQVFTGCSNQAQDGSDSGTETTAAPAASEETVPEETEELTDYELRQRIPDNLPSATFDGRAFRVLTTEDGYGGRVTKKAEIISEELSGDACNDAVYNRNIRLEERFDITISCETHTDPQTYVNTFVTAGTDDYDLVGFYNYLAASAISAGSLLNWNDATYVDLSQPWHNSLANDAATVYGSLYAICSDLSISSMTYTYAIFFNLALIEDYGYTSADLYGIVKEGAWTIDRFIEITTPMHQDKNGDGKKDISDIYGFGYQVTNPGDVWIAAFDQPICEVNEEGGISITFMSDKTVSIIEKLIDWHYNNEGFYKYSTQYDEETYFHEGKLVFAPLRFYAAYNVLRDMEDPYSILPYPKWDENQQQYLTNADDKFTAFGLPLTAYQSLDFVSIVYEALCAESYKTVYPEYYDTALKGKYSQERETAEMIDLIMEGRDFDFSFQFAGLFQQLPYFIRNHINDNNINISSSYKKIQKALDKTVEKQLLKMYEQD